MPEHTLDDIKNMIQEAVKKETESLKKETESLRKEIGTLKEENAELWGALHKLDSSLEEAEQYNRKSSLILMGGGITEGSREETTQETREVAEKVIKEKLNVELKGGIAACHRLRNKKRILVKFLDQGDREAVYQSKFKQTGEWKERVAIHENLTQQRASMVKALGDMQRENKITNFYTRNGKIMARSSTDKQYTEIQYWYTEKQVTDKTDKAPKRNTDNTRLMQSQTLQNIPDGRVAHQAANLENYVVGRTRQTRLAAKKSNGAESSKF